MRVTFVDNFFCHPGETTQSVGISPHLGLLSLAAALEAAGHEVKIFDPKLEFARLRLAAPDPPFIEACGRAVLAQEPDVLGFTAYGISFPFAVKLAQWLRHARPSLPIALGGPHPTIVGKRILERFPCFDVIVRFEAETTIVAIVLALHGKGGLIKIPNLVVRSGGIAFETRRDPTLVDLETLPQLPFALYPLRELELSELPVEAGRGCPFPCTFCSTANFFQRKYRLKSAARLVAEMDELHHTWHVSEFSLNHDLFGLRKAAVHEFCALVRGRGYSWKCSMRADLVAEETLVVMAEAGCSLIFFGVESGSARIQQSMQKRLDLSAVRVTLRQVEALGMQSVASFVIGFPDEERADLAATLDMASELMLSSDTIEVQTHMLSPEPGSRLLGELGDQLDFDGFGPELGGFIDDEMIRSAPDIFSVFYHFRGRVPHWDALVAASSIEALTELLGRPTLMHVLAIACDGRLSVLVERLLLEPPPLDTSAASVKAFIREGLLQRGLGPDCPAYLRDLLRFVVTFKALEAEPERTARRASGRVQLALGARIEIFQTDPVSALQAVLRDPRRPHTESSKSTPCAYVLFVAAGDYHVRSLPHDTALRLQNGEFPPLSRARPEDGQVIEGLEREGLLEASQ